MKKKTVRITKELDYLNKNYRLPVGSEVNVIKGFNIWYYEIHGQNVWLKTGYFEEV